MNKFKKKRKEKEIYDQYNNEQVQEEKKRKGNI